MSHDFAPVGPRPPEHYERILEIGTPSGPLHFSDRNACPSQARQAAAAFLWTRQRGCRGPPPHSRTSPRGRDPWSHAQILMCEDCCLAAAGGCASRSNCHHARPKVVLPAIPRQSRIPWGQLHHMAHRPLTAFLFRPLFFLQPLSGAHCDAVSAHRALRKPTAHRSVVRGGNGALSRHVGCHCHHFTARRGFRVVRAVCVRHVKKKRFLMSVSRRRSSLLCPCLSRCSTVLYCLCMACAC